MSSKCVFVEMFQLCQMPKFECDVERCNLLDHVCFEGCMLCVGVSVVVQCSHEVWLFVDDVAECVDVQFLEKVPLCENVPSLSGFIQDLVCRLHNLDCVGVWLLFFQEVVTHSIW